MEATNLLYQTDFYLKSCPAVVQAVLPGINGTDYSLILDQTVCFPEGGGQPCDYGEIPGYGQITGVHHRDGAIWHYVTAHPAPTGSAPCPPPTVGTAVTVELDWPRRFSHMQRHCGEHILSAVFYDRFGGVNRGFHMGPDYMTIDINLEDRPDITALTDADMLTAEWAANQMIWADLPVTVRRFATRAEAASQPMRKTLALDEDITLVCVGSEAEPAGCVACCGTHPATTGPVGLIKLYKWENYKGMYRITFDAGEIALQSVREQAAVLRELSRRYSAEIPALPAKLAAADEKNQAIRKQLHDLKQLYAEEQAQQLISRYLNHPPPTVASAGTGRPKAGGPSLLLAEYPVLKADDLMQIGLYLPDHLPILVALISTSETALFLKSNGQPDCHKLIRDNAPVWNGKGGGRPDSARVMFPKRSDLDCFVAYLKQNYRLSE